MLTTRREHNLRLRLLADLEEARASARMLGNDFVEYLIAMAELEVTGAGAAEEDSPLPDELCRCLKDCLRRL